ncbi:MAG TPA: DUF350 domain-containing protein [Chloroflexi bacterium]|nr:DUF350 domain-containing protein [Chloroflexota bacterium]
MKQKLFALSFILAIWPANLVLAQEPDSLVAAFLVWEFVSSVVYGLLGIALAILGYFAFDKLAQLDLKRELVEDQNIALGIMLAGVFIGIAIVVAAAIK